MAADTFYTKMNKANAKILLIIPVAVFGTMIISFLSASILEFPTDRGTVYSFFIMLTLAIFFLAPLPCLIASIVGTVIVGKIKKTTNENLKILFELGIIDITVSIMITFLAICVFIGGQSN